VSGQLAIDGGAPVRAEPLPPMYPGGMMIGDEEKRAVMEVLDSKNLFRYYGPSQEPSRVVAFEEAFARHLGATHSLAVTSGTAALHTALVGLGIGPGDEVIIPAYTFIASAAAVIAARAVPVICDIDESLTMDPEDAERKITPRTKALMPVHMVGVPCDMGRIMDVAGRHHLRVLEDTAQAVGASYRGRRLGTIGDAGAFSLQINKIITAGEGGVITTSDQVVYERSLIFHDDAGIFRGRQPLSIPYFAGVNYRMSELTGAVAEVQLERLEGLLQTMRVRKRAIKDAVRDRAEAREVEFRAVPDPDGEAAVALIMLLPSADKAHQVAAALSAENIGASVLFHRDNPDWHVAYHWDWVIEREVSYDPESTPRAQDLLGRGVRIEISPLLTDNDAEQVATGMLKVVEALL
jgi:dTDP-4-amino-4,6-dideoxygalactose transaminase